MSQDFWYQRPVLVTGATGLLGSWLVKHLLDHDAQVVALVRDHVPQSMLVREGVINKIPLVHGGLDSIDTLRRTIAEYNVATIFHLAAQTLVGIAKLDPIGTLEANVRGTWNLLEAVRQASPRTQVLVASSDKA